MGRVWRARDEMLERPVAVKELWLDGPDAGEDPGTRRERALREARASARIDHPGVVRVYDVAEEDDRLWIVMELVEAPSLERTVAERGPLGVRETARIGLALAEALRRVHGAGVLHRDVKPGNVLLGPGPRVVLTDFGIAALQDSQRLTRGGMVLGSPEYMPPRAGHWPGPGTRLRLVVARRHSLHGADRPLAFRPAFVAGDAPRGGVRGARTSRRRLSVDAPAAWAARQGSGAAARRRRDRGVPDRGGRTARTGA
ncbi:serine/threonine-protein kinase [Streptomyces sp. NPDC051001]|uniref:serine/threonine-protein kinase n=1 Tax=Streptomyces sp. NPDC051001 TaxID=3155795 RepID=UPI00341CE900